MTQRLIPAYAASHRPGLQLLPTQSYREYQTMSNDSTIDLTGESLHFISIDPVPARIAVQVDTSNFEQGRGCLSLRAVGGSSDGVITVQFMLGRTMATELTLNVKPAITTLFVLGYHVDAEHQIHLDLISVADQPVPISGGGGSSGSPFDAAEFLNAAIDPDGWLRSLGGTTDINNDGEPETWLHLAGMTLPIPQSGSLMGQIIIPETIQYTGIPKWLRIYGAESLFLPDGGNQPNRHSIGLPNPGTVAFTLTTSQLTLTVDAETVSYPVTANAKLCILVEEFAVDDAIRVVLQA